LTFLGQGLRSQVPKASQWPWVWAAMEFFDDSYWEKPKTPPEDPPTPVENALAEPNQSNATTKKKKSSSTKQEIEPSVPAEQRADKKSPGDVQGQPDTTSLPRPYGVMGRSIEWEKECGRWPLRFSGLRFAQGIYSEQTYASRVYAKVPAQGTSPRLSSNAKRPTCLSFQLQTTEKASAEKKYIPLKITGRIRSIKTRGEVVSRIEYLYTDGTKILIGSGGAKMQIASVSANGGIPQAFLIPNKTEQFMICTDKVPSKVW